MTCCRLKLLKCKGACLDAVPSLPAHLDFAGACFLYSMKQATNISTQLAPLLLLQAIRSLVRSLPSLPHMQDQQAAQISLRTAVV